MLSFAYTFLFVLIFMFVTGLFSTALQRVEHKTAFSYNAYFVQLFASLQCHVFIGTITRDGTSDYKAIVQSRVKFAMFCFVSYLYYNRRILNW